MSDKPSAEVISTLKKQHGDKLIFAKIQGSWVGVRPPTVAEWDRYQDRKEQGEGKVALSELTGACVIYPERSAYEAFVARCPIAPAKLSDRVVELGGGVEEDVLKT
jgi:hypothetical protein